MKKKTTKPESNGAIPDNVGFPGFKGEGYVQPLQEQLAAIRANGFEVEETPDGILITPQV